jgi:hypothetical protein
MEGNRKTRIAEIRIALHNHIWAMSWNRAAHRIADSGDADTIADQLSRARQNGSTAGVFIA